MYSILNKLSFYFYPDLGLDTGERVQKRSKNPNRFPKIALVGCLPRFCLQTPMLGSHGDERTSKAGTDLLCFTALFNGPLLRQRFCYSLTLADLTMEFYLDTFNLFLKTSFKISYQDFFKADFNFSDLPSK